MVYVGLILLAIIAIMNVITYYQVHINQVKIINNQDKLLDGLTTIYKDVQGPRYYLVIKKWYNGTQSGTVIKASDKTEALQIATEDGKEHKEYELGGIF